MFGKIQTPSALPLNKTLPAIKAIAASACLLMATTSYASLSAGSDLKLAKATADDLVCHTFSIEIQSAQADGGFNFFPNVEQGCVKRILTHQPQLLQGATYRPSNHDKTQYSYNR